MVEITRVGQQRIFVLSLTVHSIDNVLTVRTDNGLNRTYNKRYKIGIKRIKIELKCLVLRRPSGTKRISKTKIKCHIGQMLMVVIVLQKWFCKNSVAIVFQQKRRSQQS